MTKGRKKVRAVADTKPAPGKIEQAHIQQSKERWLERERSRGPVEVAAGTNPAGGLLVDTPIRT